MNRIASLIILITIAIFFIVTTNLLLKVADFQMRCVQYDTVPTYKSKDVNNDILHILNMEIMQSNYMETAEYSPDAQFDFMSVSQLFLVDKISIRAKNTQLACDTDGAPKDCEYAKKDRHYQPETSYQINGKQLDATKVNYIVYPNNDYRGLLGIIVDLNSGNYTFVVCGDFNPNSLWHEVSLHTLWDLGYAKASGNNAPTGNFVSIIFEDSKIKSYDSSIDVNLQIRDKVIKILEDNNIDINLLINELLEENYGNV